MYEAPAPPIFDCIKRVGWGEIFDKCAYMNNVLNSDFDGQGDSNTRQVEARIKRVL